MSSSEHIDEILSNASSAGSNAISQKRNELRAEARACRAKLPEPYRAHKSAEICKRLEETLTLTLGITGTVPQDCIVAVYAAFPEEVNLENFIQHAYEQGCKVAFPCMMTDAWGIPDAPHRAQGEAGHVTQQTMEMRVVPAERYQAADVPFLNKPLKRFAHRDAELADLPYIAADELTMIVVPVVGFDKHGNRLGYGKGNYDRYLAQIPQHVRIAGVAFAEQQVDDVPTEEHDIPLPIISL